MFTFLDLLIVVVMALAAVGLAGLSLMFLVKNRKVQQVCLYIVAALGVYIGTVGFRINWPGFEGQVGLAVLMAVVSAGAVVLERVKKGDDKFFRLSQILATAGLVIGMANAFFI